MNSETYRDLPIDVQKELEAQRYGVEIDESIPGGHIVHTVRRELSAQQLIDEVRRKAKARDKRKAARRNLTQARRASR